MESYTIDNSASWCSPPSTCAFSPMAIWFVDYFGYSVPCNPAYPISILAQVSTDATTGQVRETLSEEQSDPSMSAEIIQDGKQYRGILYLVEDGE